MTYILVPHFLVTVPWRGHVKFSRDSLPRVDEIGSEAHLTKSFAWRKYRLSPLHKVSERFGNF